MNIELVRQVLREPEKEQIEALLHDEGTVFWVDWRQEDDTIAGDCEHIIKTGSLSGEVVEVETDEGYEVHFHYRDRSIKVPLTYSRADRHIALLSLNELLDLDFEIRFCTASAGSDTLAFLPLTKTQWASLEREFGQPVAKHFRKITLRPNLFTEPIPI